MDQKLSKKKDKKIALGLDIDGVVYPFHLHMHRFLLDKGFIDNSVTYEELWRNVSKYEDIIEQHAKNPEIYDKKIDNSIVAAINDLSNMFDIYYITSRSNFLIQDTVKWFESCKLSKGCAIVFVNTSDRSKATIAKTLKIDYFVEDRTNNIIALSEVTNVIAIRQIWNESLWNSDYVSLWIDSVLDLKNALFELMSSEKTHKK